MLLFLCMPVDGVLIHRAVAYTYHAISLVNWNTNIDSIVHAVSMSFWLIKHIILISIELLYQLVTSYLPLRYFLWYSWQLDLKLQARWSSVGLDPFACKGLNDK